MEKFFVRLEREPPVRLNCTFVGQSTQSPPSDKLIVYLNGIDNPQKMWYPTVAALLRRTKNPLSMLLYDRPGQGAPGRPEGHGRDCLSAAHDLRELIVQVAGMRLGIHKSAIDEVRIIFVASSIGCAIARLYASEYPRTVSALLLLDSIIANSDAVSLLPDPQSPGFSEGGLPEGITVELLYDARQKVGRYYHPNTPNKEGLWWGNLPTLLPHSDTPQLRGPNTRTPYVTVMEHDRDVWCAEAEKFNAIAKIVLKVYFDPAWHRYNEGIAKITSRELSKGPVEAKGCGHLIHKDNPELVANEISELLDKLRQDQASHI